MSESESNTGGETKHYDGYLIVNWRDDKVRFRKTPPENSTAPHELAIPLDIDVTVPEVSVPTIEAAIEVPPAQVEEAVVDETRELAEERGVEFEDE